MNFFRYNAWKGEIFYQERNTSVCVCACLLFGLCVSIKLTVFINLPFKVMELQIHTHNFFIGKNIFSNG